MVVVAVLPRSMRVAVIVVSIVLLLYVLYVTEIGVQPFEALLPMASVLADPVGDVAQAVPLAGAVAATAPAFPAR